MATEAEAAGVEGGAALAVVVVPAVELAVDDEPAPEEALEGALAGVPALALELPEPLPPGGSTETPPFEGAAALELPLLAEVAPPEELPELAAGDEVDEDDVEEPEAAFVEGLAVDEVDDVDGDDVAGCAGL